MSRNVPIGALAVRLAAIALLGVAATAGGSLAASHGVLASHPTAAAETTEAPQPLVVPDVRGQAFVFAKGALEDGGFAWKVKGAVHGYPANTVVSQSPAPGTRVEDTGAPLVVVTLRKTKGYPQAGEPADRSPYPASRVVLAGYANG